MSAATFARLDRKRRIDARILENAAARSYASESRQALVETIFDQLNPRQGQVPAADGSPANVVELAGRYSNYAEQIKRTKRCATLHRKSWPARSTVLPPAPRRLDVRLDEQLVQQLLADYQAGSTGRQLADRYGLARSTVIELLRKHGVPVRYPRVRPAEAAEMLALYRTGVRQVDIAARFDRAPGNVWHVLKRAGAFLQPG